MASSAFRIDSMTRYASRAQWYVSRVIFCPDERCGKCVCKYFGKYPNYGITPSNHHSIYAWPCDVHPRRGQTGSAGERCELCGDIVVAILHIPFVDVGHMPLPRFVCVVGVVTSVGLSVGKVGSYVWRYLGSGILPYVGVGCCISGTVR